jgi:hypothetical protein
MSGAISPVINWNAAIFEKKVTRQIAPSVWPGSSAPARNAKAPRIDNARGE